MLQEGMDVLIEKFLKFVKVQGLSDKQLQGHCISQGSLEKQNQ